MVCVLSAERMFCKREGVRSCQLAMIIYRGPSGHHISQRRWRTMSASTIHHSPPPLRHILENITAVSTINLSLTEGMDLALESQGFQQYLLDLRMTVLDEWSQYTTSHHVHRRALAHGNIGADMRTIAFMEEWNTDRAERWKTAFAEYYGEDYRVCVERNVRHSHRELLEIFNITANIKALYKWHTKTIKADREEIQAECSSIIEEWKRGAGDLFQDGSSTITDYREAMQLYHKY